MRSLVAFVVFQLSFVGSSWGENWPQWRGPHGNGVSSETGLPAEWRGDENVAWKAPIRGLGVSSPIVWEGTIVLTSQLGRGTVRQGNLPSLTRGEDPSERSLGQPAEPDEGAAGSDVRRASR